MKLGIGKYALVTISLAALALSCSASATAVGIATRIADSVNDFSSTQGDAGWFYGYYEGQFTPGNFEPFPQFDEAAQIWHFDFFEPAPRYWTLLSDEGGHPNGIANDGGGRERIEQWAVRRYVSPVSGDLRLNLRLEDRAKFPGFGTGFVARVFVDGQPILDQIIAEGSSLQTLTLPVTVNQGSVLDFAIDPNQGDDGNDSSTFEIEVFEFQPQPAAIISVESTSTFLQPADPRDIPVEVGNSFPIELGAETLLPFAVQPGDYIRLQAVGSFDFALADDNSMGPLEDGTLIDAVGVFSGSGELLPIDLAASPLPNRVPESVAVDDGDVVEVGALPGFPETDIPNDFVIPSELGATPEGVVVRVPEGATHLFLGAADIVWSDNTDGGSENVADVADDYGVRVTRLYEGRLVGDYNFDGVVDAADYTVWRDSLNAEGIDLPADGNLDGVVDEVDYAVWTEGFGTVVGSSSEPASAVPEPGALILLGLAFVPLNASRCGWRGRTAKQKPACAD